MNSAPFNPLFDSLSIRLKQFTPDVLVQIDPITIGLARQVQALHCPNGTTGKNLTLAKPNRQSL